MKRYSDTVVGRIRVGDVVLWYDPLGQLHYDSGTFSWRTIKALKYNLNWLRQRGYKVTLDPEHRLNSLLKRIGAKCHRYPRHECNFYK